MTLTQPTPVDNQTGKLLGNIVPGTLGFSFTAPWTGPTVSPPNYVRLVVDPSLIGVPNALYEVMYGNVGNGSPVFTCLAGTWGNGRGVEQSSAQNHVAGANWDCSSTAAEIVALTPSNLQARLFGTVASTAGAGQDNVVALDSVDYDNSPLAAMAVPNAIQNGSATGHILISVAGIYLFTWSTAWQAGTLGTHRSGIFVNPSFGGGLFFSSLPTRQGNRTADIDTGPSVGAEQVKCAINDTVYLGAFQTNAQTITRVAGNFDGTTFLSASLIRAI